jgi:hypothetical protein
MLRCLFAVRLPGMIAVVLLAGVIAGARISPSVAGTTTTTATTPAVSLDAASCAGQSCFAVGEEDFSQRVALPFAERWAGGVWQQDPVPQPSRTTMRISALNAVSCWSTRGCVAVGTFFPSCCTEKAFSEEWTGSSWKVARHVGPPGFQPDAMSCASARFCVAVGDGSDRGWVEQWTGSRWVREPTPDPNSDPNTDLESGQSVNLTGVACSDRGACVAIGNWEAPSQTRYRPLAEAYQQGRWVLTQAPVAPKELSYEFNSIACPTSTECVAVGFSAPWSRPGVPVKNARPLLELWNGQGWVAQRLPRPTGPRTSLDSVSCASPTSCTALGAPWDQPYAPFADRWNGRTWTRETIAIPPQTSSPQFSFTQVFCATRSACTAVLAPPNTAGAIIAQLAGGVWSLPSRS